MGKVKVEIYFFTLSKVVMQLSDFKGGRCIWGLKAKTDYLILDTKLLLINMNHVEFFSYFRNFIDTKNLTKLFTLIDVTD